jgi:deoxyribose-phosphate aldolase
MIKRLDVKTLTQKKLAKTIDHSLLNPIVTDDDLREGCKLADKYHTATVCVKPYHVKRASELLLNSDVKVCMVIGFPQGGHLPKIKALEAEQAIADGAKELDMVMNIGAIKSKRFSLARQDIKVVVDVARKHKDILVKVILENCYLSDDEKITSCKLAEEAGADYVKSSTGFGTGGATIHDIELMYETVGPRLGVKAAGGVRSLETALDVIRAGATRIGATATEKIIESWIKFQTKTS